MFPRSTKSGTSRRSSAALEPVRIGDTLRNNFINLEFKNFCITEKGDLRDIAEFLSGREDLDEDTDFAPPPNFMSM